MMEDRQRLEQIVSDLHYQYPWSQVTTNSQCPDCGGASRGGRRCSNCLTIELAKMVGDALAREYQRQVALLRQMYWQMEDKVILVASRAKCKTREECEAHGVMVPEDCGSYCYQEPTQ